MSVKDAEKSFPSSPCPVETVIQRSIGGLHADAVILCFGTILLILAWAHGPRLDDDSYTHFAVSVLTVAELDWRSLVTDTWNKPLTTMMYGVAGLVGGLGLSRSVSVLLVLMTAILVRKILELWLGWGSRQYPWFVPAFFLLQIGLLPQSFLTMTEQVAAALLAASLLAFVTDHRWLAFVSGGFLPHARLESVFIVAALFCTFSLNLLRSEGMRAFGRVATMNTMGALPFIGWWAAGLIWTGQPTWILASYAYLREPIWQELWSVNAFTGLCGALSTVQVTMVIMGVLMCRQAPNNRLPIYLILAPLFTYLCFTSLVVVYPPGSGYENWAIAALNARSYIIVAPLLCLLAGLGYHRFFNISHDKTYRTKPEIWYAVILTLLPCFGFFYFQQAFASVFGLVAKIGQLILGLGFLGLGAGIAWSWTRHRWRHAANAYACLAICTAPLMVPFFWYPLQWQDRRIVVQKAFLERLQGAAVRPPLVLQSMNGKLDFFAGGTATPIAWCYPALLKKCVAQAPAGAWVVIGADKDGIPVGYTPECIQALEDRTMFDQIGLFVDKRTKSQWEQAIDVLTSRNRVGGWIIYRKQRA